MKLATVSLGSEICIVSLILLCLLSEQHSALGQSSTINKEIVIVNIGKYNKDSLATIIKVISSLEPQVISVDVALPTYSGDSTDENLRRILIKCKHLVMPSRVRNIGKDYYGKDIILVGLSCAMPFFPNHAKTGFVSAKQGQNDLYIPKQFMVWQKSYTNDTYYHFSVVTAMQFDSLKTAKFIHDNEKLVNVNYGVGRRFTVFSSSYVLNHGVKRTDVQGKIVLLGFLGPGDDDLFHLYSNEKNRDKTMYGVEYLANIVAQVLESR